MTTNVHKLPPKPQRTPAEQAIWEEAVEAAKQAMVSALKNGEGDAHGLSEALTICLSFTLGQAIDAACLPPPEPEIEVTEAMVLAGQKAAGDVGRYAERYPESEMIYRAIYRAMERQRRADEAGAVKWDCHRRYFKN